MISHCWKDKLESSSPSSNSASYFFNPIFLSTMEKVLHHLWLASQLSQPAA
jgi:hypothetical protein